MLEEYNVSDLIRVHSKDYLEDKYEWKYDVEKDLNTPATFRENMLQYCGKEAIVVRNQGDLFYTLSFDGHVSHYCFDAESIYKDNSNYHQVRCLDEEHLAELISDITKSPYRTKEQVIKWLATDKKVGEL